MTNSETDTEWTAIRVRKTARDKAQEQKRDGQTWSEYIADENREVDGVGELARAVKSLESSLSTVEERTGRIERTLEEMQR